MPETQRKKTSATTSSSQLPIDKFLEDYDLFDLHQIFVEEGVTMDVLLTFDENDLINVGVKEYGHRIKILNSLSAINEQGRSGI